MDEVLTYMDLFDYMRSNDLESVIVVQGEDEEDIEFSINENIKCAYKTVEYDKREGELYFDGYTYFKCDDVFLVVES